MSQAIETLKALLPIWGPSGREQLVADLLVIRRSQPSAEALERYQTLFDERQQAVSPWRDLVSWVAAALRWDSRQQPALAGVRRAGTRSYRIIYESAPIPGSPFAVRGDIDPELKAKIKEFLLSYDNTNYFETWSGDASKRFVEMTIDDYKGINDLAKQLEGK